MGGGGGAITKRKFQNNRNERGFSHFIRLYFCCLAGQKRGVTCWYRVTTITICDGSGCLIIKIYELIGCW